MESRRLAPFALLALATAARADIRYTVAPVKDQSRLSVTMLVPVKGTETLLQMPRWAPGAYVLSTPARNLKDLAAADASGAPLTVAQVDDSTWRVTGGSGTIRVSYTMPAQFADEVVHYSGPATYLYVVGRKDERCTLHLDVPNDWLISVGLDPLGGRGSYVAKTYDVLADNPVSTGHMTEMHYVTAGKPMTISMRGVPKKDVDRNHLVQAAKFVSDMETDFFGGAPFHRYVWHFGVYDAPDGAGGLEHLSSTQIGLSSGVGPRAVGVLGHEFFHLWNVKRIRSRVLGPFDYTQLPQTGALWWLEGVTDYYAHLLLNRYGWFDGGEMREQIARNMVRQRGRPARFEVSPYEASYRVREANNGLGNSDGYKVSYYDTGFLVGLCLDVELLSQTHGRRSLDDVEHALWQLCRDDRPGFEEGEIRNQLVRVGGAPLGAMYDTIVTKPGELPLEAQLAKIGLQISKTQEPMYSFGFTSTPSTDAHGFVVRSIEKPTQWPGLKVGDVLLAANGIPIAGDTTRAMQEGMSRFMANAKADRPTTLRVRRGGEEVVILGNGSTVPQEVVRVIDLPGASPEALRLQRLWLAKRRG